MKLQFIAFALFSLILAACSPSASQLKKVMQANPDILHAAIEADPKGFFEIVQKVQGKAREASMDEQMGSELARVMEEMKAPKEVTIGEGRVTKGPATAVVTIVEWADFNCGHCSGAAETMEKIANEYKDKVRIVYKHLPILSKESRIAAEYMEAIAIQSNEMALKFHTELFAKQKELREGGEEFLKTAARSVGADLAAIKKELKSDVVKKRIDGDIAEAQKFEFNGTPGFMVNGAGVHGAYPHGFFKKVIDAVLASAK